MQGWVAFNVRACTERKFFLLVAFVIIQLQRGVHQTRSCDDNSQRENSAMYVAIIPTTFMWRCFFVVVKIYMVVF